MGEIKEITGS